jgi:hypothetical protein
MLRRTMTILAVAAALIGGLTADAAALATAHSGWDGLGDGGAYRGGSGGGAHIGGGFGRGRFGGPGKASSRGFAGPHFPAARGHRIAPASAIGK